MKDFIKISLCIAVLTLVTLYSNAIASYAVDSYNTSIEFLASNTLATSNPIRF